MFTNTLNWRGSFDNSTQTATSSEPRIGKGFCYWRTVPSRQRIFYVNISERFRTLLTFKTFCDCLCVFVCEFYVRSREKKKNSHFKTFMRRAQEMFLRLDRKMLQQCFVPLISYFHNLRLTFMPIANWSECCNFYI